MRSYLVFLLLVPLVACFSCPPNITQELVKSSCTSFTYEVTITNPYDGLLNQLELVACSNISEIDGMFDTGSGVSFPCGFYGIPANQSYYFNYTTDSNPVTFAIAAAECVLTVSTSSPTAGATSAPTVQPTEKPTMEPTEAPTSAPSSAPSSAPTSVPTAPATGSNSHGHNTPKPSKPTTAPTSRPSQPTTAPTSKPSNPTTAPTSQPTTAPSKPTTKPTSAPSNTTISGTCSGTPRMLNGKPCATTTRYWDDQEGACGCGGSSGAFDWIGTTYTAAASPPLFGTATWCGTGCGKCYQLTATGFSPDGKGAPVGATITVMVTNLCPPGGAWCAAGLNSFEYGAHFDLADSPTAALIDNLGWDNPEVVYEEVPCTGSAALTASDSDYAQCLCDQPGTVSN